MSTANETKPIDLFHVLRQFVRALKRFWLPAVLLAAILAGVSFFRDYRSYRPMYEARAQFTVSSGYGADDIFASTYYDNAAAEALAQAFPHLLRTELMQDLMRQQLGTAYINGTVTSQAVANTNLFTLTVRSSSAEDAYNVLCAAIDCWPQVAVYMVDNPQVIIRRAPTMPTEPCNGFSWKRSVLKGGALGVGVGLALLLVLAMYTRTVSSVDQLKELVNLPVLGVVPRVRRKKRRNDRGLIPGAPALREPFRGLKLKVDKLEGSKQVLLVTSTVNGEGKTTVAANLALALAADGSRVVLVDGDLRSQSVAERFGKAPGRRGLMECMKDPGLSVTECLTAVNDNLSLLSGSSATDLRYNVDAKAMRRILAELREKFDYVVMDTAPCAMVPDTALQCNFADRVLYVVKPDCASRNQIYDTVSDLYDRSAPLTGTVLNDVPAGQSHYGYRYGYKYGYGRSE